MTRPVHAALIFVFTSTDQVEWGMISLASCALDGP